MKDERYDAIKSLIENKKIIKLEQWFKYIPKTNIAKDAGIHPERFNTLINHIERFSIEEIQVLADLIEVEWMVICNLLYQEYQELRKNSPKSKSRGARGKRSSTM